MQQRGPRPALLFASPHMSSPQSVDKFTRGVYGLATGDEDARVCKDVPEAACNHLPRNFLIHVVALSATKSGDHLASAKLVLVWLLAAVGAPGFMAGMTVPIRESLALIPQLFVAALIRRRPIRKGFWVWGSVIQGLCVGGMGMAAWQLQGAVAGWAILGLLVCFSLARGVCSVAIKDVQGKTVSKFSRGKASGYASSVAGGVALTIGASGFFVGDHSLGFLIWLCLGAALMWLAAGLTYHFVVEEPGATAGGANAGSEAIRQLVLLRKNAQFRWFVITRALFLSSAFAFPFLVLMTREQTGAAFSALGSMLIAVGIANLIGGTVWGRMADRSSRRVLMLTGGLAGLTCLAAWSVQTLDVHAVWVFALLYFGLALAHSGIRLGRSTYLIDMATQETRAAYTAVSNTVIGVLLLAGGSLSALEPLIGAEGLVLLFGVGVLIAAAAAFWLPEVQEG